MKKILGYLLKTILFLIGFSIVWVLFHKFVPVPYTPLMAIRYFEGDKDYTTRHEWKSIEDISANLQLAVICAEDQNFLIHNGFDMKAIEKAIENNKRKGKRVKGASGISQQTAKNVFLWPGRNWIRKGLESWFTLLIETLWSKERILEVYLNSIEMGNGVYGAEAASQYWFKKSAKNLRQSEAAAIAAILPNPRRYKASPRSSYIQGRVNWITRQMGHYGPFELKKQKEK